MITKEINTVVNEEGVKSIDFDDEREGEVVDSDNDLYEEYEQREQDNGSQQHQNNAPTRIEEMKKRITELEEETNAIKEMQAKVASELGLNSSPSNPSEPTKEVVDSCSVFVGNDDYSCTPKDLRFHFLACGTVNRITVKTDHYGHPKGFAYVETRGRSQSFDMNDFGLRNRKLKVARK